MTACKEDRFERSGEANVKDWGAIGDGQADDTDAFECAIAHVVSAPAGGVLYIPPGTFKINKRLDIETCKPFVIRGAAQDVSRLLWHECAEGEGIGIEPSGCVTKVVNDGHVSVERLSLICWSGKESRSSGLLINGQKQLNEQGKLCCRPVHRFKVSDVAITGRWLFGLVLRSAHLCTLQNLNITGDEAQNGCRAAILMDGVGSPTEHIIECCRLYHWGIGIHLNSNRDKGRIEGVKVHNCNIVAVNRGVVADCVLELSVVQNHMNCRNTCIDAIDCDQSFYMCNLLYHQQGEGQGIKISGTRPAGQKPSSSHCVNGNTVIAVHSSKALSGIEVDGNVHTATITNNTTAGGLHGVNSKQAEEQHHMLRNIYCSGNMMMGVKGEPYHVPPKGVIVDHSSDEQRV